jgi:ribonucleoside-diphosphate reductase alpha chain
LTMTPKNTNEMIESELNTLREPIVSENALKVLKNRYLAKDKEGKIIEDPKGMYIRVAKAIAGAEATEDKQSYYAWEFYDMMASNKFLPNSPCLMNAGRELGMLSACFVLGVEDNLVSILDTQRALALVQRAGGGTGFSFNSLRPSGSVVGSSGGLTSGPLAFIDAYSGTTTAIQQGAFRRGANMGILGVRHPDIIKFISHKQDLTKLQNYNISVAMTDEFMEELELHPNRQHDVSHPKWGEGSLCKNKITQEIKAIKKIGGSFEDIAKEIEPNNWIPWTIKDTWDLICKRAHDRGEPGLFFVDEANRNNPIKNVGEIVATNPCGEQPLHDWDSCNLGSINLSKFYHVSTDVDWDELAKTVTSAVRFLDNVIDVNNYPLAKIEEVSKMTRRIGLGVMGFADLLFMCGIAYDSKEARDLADEIQSYISQVAEKISASLGKEKGNFGAWEDSTYGSKGLNLSMRNSYRTTVAPTGTISILANCSGGIEPIYALAFERNVMPDSEGNFTTMMEVNEHFKSAASNLIRKDDSWDALPEMLIRHVEGYGSLEKFDTSPWSNEVKKFKETFVTAHEISMEDHVDMQIAWQKHVDSAISKTINLPHDAPVEDVQKAYMRAYMGSLKGITVYRDGCRDNVAGMKQPMSTSKTSETKEPVEVKQQGIVGFDNAYKTSMRTQWGSLHVTIVVNDTGDPIEFFAQLGKAGDTIAADLEAICRFGSLALRKGASLEEVIDQAALIGSVDIMPSEHGKITSLPDALSKVLSKFLAKETKTAAEPVARSYGLVCPVDKCSGKLIMAEGCKKCSICDYSAC